MRAKHAPGSRLFQPARETKVTTSKLMLSFAFALAFAAPLVARADPPGDPAAVKQDEQGLWHDKNGDPTYKIDADGAVDWNTFSGFRRYNAACIVCHGPDGAGSSYAPALADSLKAMNYAEFFGTVVSGRKDLRNGNDLVMPAFGDNK